MRLLRSKHLCGTGNGRCGACCARGAAGKSGPPRRCVARDSGRRESQSILLNHSPDVVLQNLANPAESSGLGDFSGSLLAGRHMNHPRVRILGIFCGTRRGGDLGGRGVRGSQPAARQQHEEKRHGLAGEITPAQQRYSCEMEHILRTGWMSTTRAGRATKRPVRCYRTISGQKSAMPHGQF